MASTVRTLLENALYLSIADREQSPIEPDGSQINQALNNFIQVLDSYRDLIPFWTEKVLNGESELVNIGASMVNFVDYLIGNVVYNLRSVTQDEFSNLALVTNLRAVPNIFWFDEGQQTLRVYPLPETSTRKFVIGYKPLNIISYLDQEIPNSIPQFMQLFLQYEVARNICNESNSSGWTPMKEQARKEYYQRLLENSQTVLTSPRKIRLSSPTSNVPYLAYLSGNVPTG